MRFRARHQLPADPRRLRHVLQDVEVSLGRFDGETRRRASLLVGAITDQWARRMPEAVDRIELEIERAPSRLRITAITDADDAPPAIWEELGGATAGLADRWGVDRRRDSAAWFVMAPPAPRDRAVT